MATNKSNFIHGNWNPARSSTNNIFMKSGKSNKNRCISHEYPITAGHAGALYREGVVGVNGTHHSKEEIYSKDQCQINGYGYGNVNPAFIGARYGYQYRSNPQISFASLDNTITTNTDDFDTLSTTYDKSSCNPVRLAVTRNSNRNKKAVDSYGGGSSNSSHQQIQKWKNELTAAASNIPRKWCDFVFRRNEDNKVYRSESFRFIQKTNSLALLTPVGNDGRRLKNKRASLHGISVSDDYVDPVDHVLTSSVSHYSNHSVIQGAWSASSDNTSSGSRKSYHTSEGGTSTNISGGGGCQNDIEEINRDDEPPYNEIEARYNAPYYYSDTIKEPTYINPCEDEGLVSPGCSSVSNTSSPSPVLSETLEPVTVTIVTGSLERKKDDKTNQQFTAGSRKQFKLNRRAAYLRGTSRELMARKRYETAFLPSSSSHASSSQTTPDIDSLLLAIESSCQLEHGCVSKSDISQPKATLCGCIKETSGAPETNQGKDGKEEAEQNPQLQGMEERIIYVNHPAEPAMSGTEGTVVHLCYQAPVTSTSSTEVAVPSSLQMQFSSMTTSSEPLSHSTLQAFHHHNSSRSSIVRTSELSGSNSSLHTNPSTSLHCQSSHFQHHHHPNHLHHNLNINLAPSRCSGLCSTTNSSPLSSHKLTAKPIMPLSEPLPQKRYISKSHFSSGHASGSSNGSGETRRLGHTLKDNSVSSLESIDSTKSEELSSSLHRPTSQHYGPHYSTNYQPQKLLSPISDKSPLEPGIIITNSHQREGGDRIEENNQNRAKWANNVTLLDAAELTNVPWEMPKLRRKLAKLADSGISLDFSGSGSKEAECPTAAGINYLSSNMARVSLDLSSGVNPENSQQGGQQQQGKNKNESHSTSLQLSFDEGLTRDEYYEDPTYMIQESGTVPSLGASKQSFLTASKIPGSAIVEDVTSVQVHVPAAEGKTVAAGRPDRCRMKLDFTCGGAFGGGGALSFVDPASVINPNIELERQDWFHGAITRCEAENILRATKEGSFLVRNCESTTFNRYSLSLKSFRGCIHIRIEPNSLGTFSLGDQEFPSVPHLVLHFMSHRLPIKGAEHVRLMYPVITQLL